jgi:hypothetical protein
MPNGSSDQFALKKIDNRAVLVWFWVSVVLFVAAASTAYFWRFGVELRLPASTDPASWGQFGDYLGGVLNPMIGLFTLLAVLMTVRESTKQSIAATRQAVHAAEMLEQTRREHEAEVSQERFFTLMEWLAETERKIADRGITNAIAAPLANEIHKQPSKEQIRIALNEAIAGHTISYRSFLVLLDMTCKSAKAAGRTPEEREELHKLVASRVDSDDRLIIHCLAKVDSLEPDIARRLVDSLPIPLHWSHRKLVQEMLTSWHQ